MAGGREQSPASSIAEFSREEWDALSERHNRNWFYFQALERLGLPQFKPVYFSSRIAGRLRGAIVGFLVTPEAGAEQPRASGWLQRARPAAWRRAERRVLVLGSPLDEPCTLLLPGSASLDERRGILSELTCWADEYARSHRCSALVVKGTTAETDDLWQHASSHAHLRRVRRGRSHWLRAEPAWLEACAAIVDRCFGLDLRERELKSLLGGSDPRSQPGRR